MILLIVAIICFHVLNHLLIFYYCERKKKKSDYIGNKGEKVSFKNNHKSNSLKDALVLLFTGWIRLNLLMLGKIPSHHYRIFILKNIYKMKIGSNVVIYGGFEIRFPWNIEVGKGTIIGDEAKLDGRNGIVIGENVNLSTGVWIWTEQHDKNDELFRCNEKGGPVYIENRAWVGPRVILLPKVNVAEGCVICAGAVLSKNTDSYGVYGGVPAKKIGERNKKIKYVFDGSHIPFY